MNHELLDYAVELLGNQALQNRSEAVREILSEMRKYTQQQSVRPWRPADERKSLVSLITAVSSTLEVLKGIDDGAFTGLFGARNDADGIADNAVSEISGSGNEDAPFGARDYDRLLDDLRTLKDAAEHLLEDPQLLDKGGRPDAIAEQDLVEGCYTIFEHWRQGDASTTEGADFPAFVETIAELATGETNLNFSRHVRTVLGKLRDETRL